MKVRLATQRLPTVGKGARRYVKKKGGGARRYMCPYVCACACGVHVCVYILTMVGWADAKQGKKKGHGGFGFEDDNEVYLLLCVSVVVVDGGGWLGGWLVRAWQ